MSTKGYSIPVERTPDICIYHGYCPDGFTAAWAVWKRYGDLVDFRHASYGAVPPTVDGKHVLIVDFSYSEEVLREMASKAKSITILDHHKTAQEALHHLFDEQVIEGIFDMERSGAGITWDVLHPNKPRPALVNIIEDRDLWRFKYGDITRALCMFIDTHEMNFSEWTDAARKLDREYAESFKIGHVLYQKHLKNCGHIIGAGLNWIPIEGHVVPIVNCPHIYASEIGNILAKRDDAPFGATFYIDKNAEMQVSLRSLDEKEDVGAIAKQFGGGGHRNASGFRLPPRTALAGELRFLLGKDSSNEIA